MLAVDCGQSVAVGDRFRLVVPTSAGIQTPLKGIRPDDHGLMISSYASSGPVEAKALDTVQAVGAFFNVLREGVRINYLAGEGEAVSPGAMVQLVLKFTPAMPILRGEILEVSLPGFSAGLSTCDDRRSAVAGDHFSRATWSVSESSLLLTASEEIQSYSLVQVNILQSFGLMLPLNGLELNHPTLLAQGDFFAGPVIPTKVMFSDAVPVITDARMVVTPPRARGANPHRLVFHARCDAAPHPRRRAFPTHDAGLQPRRWCG